MAEHRLTIEVMAGLLARALEEDGLTQAEFCRRVGVSPKHLNQVLRGRATARHGQLDYWAFALGRRWVISLERGPVAPLGSGSDRSTDGAPEPGDTAMTGYKVGPLGGEDECWRSTMAS